MNLYEYKIMLVDDEPELRRMVQEFLAKAGFLYVVGAGSMREAREIYRREQPALVLFDVTLPDGDGFALLKELHKESEVPVIFLSARDEDESRLRGLGLGADDYITKPFLPEELILRVQAVLRRVYRVGDVEAQNRTVTLGSCRIDLESGVVRREISAAADPGMIGKTSTDTCKNELPAAAQEAGARGAAAQEQQPYEITLTAKEYAIMEKLLANRGRIVTVDALCEAVWQEGNYGYENTLVVHIRRLREKIEEDPSHPQHLITMRGLGYKLV